MKKNIIKMYQKFQTIEEIKESINVEKKTGQIISLSSIETMLIGITFAPIPTLAFGIATIFGLGNKAKNIEKKKMRLKRNI